MSAVTQTQPPNGTLYSESEHLRATSPSSFTAVNGLESSATASRGNGDMGNSRTQSEERQQHKSQSSPSRRRMSPQRDDWDQINGGGAHDDFSDARPRQIMDDHDEGSTHSSPRKRKRSSSDEQQASSTTSHQSLGRPADSPSQPLESAKLVFDQGEDDRTRELTSGVTSLNQAHRPLQSSYPHLDDEGREDAQTNGPWYGQAVQGNNPAYNNQRMKSPDSDTELAEALQREAQGLNSLGGARSLGNHEDGDSNSTPGPQASYGTDRTPQSGVQVDHKRRKRVFSNRTKTGCMTCRRRKKKCDEAKPECNNCMRGGFVCEGYSSRNTWQKPSTNKAPIPLQAKDGFIDSSGQYPHNSLQGSHHGQSQVEEHRSPMYGKLQPGQIQTQSASGAHIRPTVVEDEGEHPQTASSPQPSDSKSTWSKRNWSNPGTESYISEHRPKTEYSQVSAPRELSNAAQQASPGNASALAGTARNPAQHNESLQLPQSTPSQVAQMALQHGASLRSSQPAGKSEKERMLKGELFHPVDQQLVGERELCKAACWRFNNSTNPTLGISGEEREHLFRKILSPQNRSTSSSPRIGKVGDRVIVEAPFTCDYGYNISIGDDVSIGANCTIQDPCSITVGSKTVIGPNVNIFGCTMPISPKLRQGSHGPSIGRSVTIEENCWIGGGAIILPGIRVAQGSVVGAGAVVTRDVPAFTVVAGNPARVQRGIYADEN